MFKMKRLKNKVLTFCLAVISLSAAAAEAPQVKDESILCKFLGIGCSVVYVSDSNGQGKEPPQLDD